MVYAGLTASLSCCLNLEQLMLKQDMLDILDITWKDKTHFIYRMYKSFYQMNTFHTSEEAKTPKGFERLERANKLINLTKCVTSLYFGWFIVIIRSTVKHSQNVFLTICLNLKLSDLKQKIFFL